MKRQEAVACLLDALQARDLAVFTTGMISREAFETCDRPASLYVIGSMGLASSLALGMALTRPDRRVVAVDGDGSLLMSMGSVAMIAREAPRNLCHVVLDNEVYGSTGNQPSASREVALDRVAGAAGYRLCRRAASVTELRAALGEVLAEDGPSFLLVKVDTAEVHGIGRVTISPDELAERFRSVAAQGS